MTDINETPTIIECHDCRTGLDLDTAYFDPIKVDKWVRCLDCHESIREAIEVALKAEGQPEEVDEYVVKRRRAIEAYLEGQPEWFARPNPDE